MMAELTKTFQKLWTFRENVNEFGWIESSGLGEIVDVVEDQVGCIHLYDCLISVLIGRRRVALFDA